MKNLQTIAVPYTIGDNLYITFSPRKLIYATISSFEFMKDKIEYKFEYKNSRGCASFTYYKDNSMVDLYEDKQEAVKACIKWAKEKGQIITEQDVSIDDETI